MSIYSIRDFVPRAHIQGRVQISNDLKQRKLGEEATKGQDHIRSVHKVFSSALAFFPSLVLLIYTVCQQDLLNVITTLQADVLSTHDLKGKADQRVQDTIIATRIIDGFRNAQQHGAYLKTHASFPLEYATVSFLHHMRRYPSPV